MMNDATAQNFTNLLTASNVGLSAEEVDDLISGIAAAPPSENTYSWLSLIAEDATSELRKMLTWRLARAQELEHGLATIPAPAQRITRLRQELNRCSLDGFLIPRSDEHQGEYVATRSERLAWISGLTASAGLVVVLNEKAAVFIDGRYTLQAKTQVNGALFQLCHLSDEPPTDWIADNLPAGGKLGYDPWLLTPNQVTRYIAACRRAGGELVAVDQNPVDTVWEDQPPAPLAPVWPLDDIYTGEAAANKARRIGNELRDNRLDAVLLTAPDSIAWVLNVRGGDVPFTPFALSFAIVHADAGIDWFIDARKLTKAARAAGSNQLRIQPIVELGVALDELGAAKKAVRLDPATAPAWADARLKNAGAQINNGVDPCQLIKAKKNTVQLSGMRAAHLRDGVAVSRFLAWLDTQPIGGGLTEMQAADQLETCRREHDSFQGLSFPTIAGSGPNGAIVHYRVTDESNRVLGAREMFLVDSGAQYLDGTTDITRTIAIGNPTCEMKHRFTLVLRGHIALAEARFPNGTSGSQLDVLARHALWAAGLDYDHGTGHGVGSFLSVHEGPHRISKLPNRVFLTPGMVISNEPGYYKTGSYGIRIENLVAVVSMERPDNAEHDVYGFETLTLAPLDRRLIDLQALTPSEITWVDNYHARVRNALAPHLDDETAIWLDQVTAPLT